MSSRIISRPLCRLVFGHEAIVEINERTNKSEYVCERCRAVLGDFVTNLRKSGAEPVERPRPADLKAAPQPIGA
ncbi:MAG TPA: hypothetical protein VL371_02745 [Gemmataceae bacterium]|jgi:hypothetical protein|nr:hypothetical protein [Gemmataceae bacterium]